MSTQGNIGRRRGWCPGVRRPMETGDGLLVRLHPFGGRLTADQTRCVAEAAREYGNGLLDITARGNLQIRGMKDETYPDLFALLEREGLVEPERDSPNRLTVLSPLAGIDPLDRCDSLALARAIENKAGHIEGLPAKVFVSVDGGGAMPLDAIGADLYLLATGDDAVAFGIPSPSGLHWIGAAPLADTPDAVHAILSGFAKMRRTARTEARRLRELPSDLVRELATRAALGPAVAPPRRPVAPRAGLLRVESHHAVLLALPFGRCSTEQLRRAADWSECFGSGEIHLSFTRSILLFGIRNENLSSLIDEAGGAGFITDAGDSRLSLLACPGRPDCASALTPAPIDALRIAEICAEPLRQGFTLHVSGCPKGCAHLGRADLTLVGRDDGRYDIVPDGSPRDAASVHLSIDEIMTRLSHLKSSDDLRRAFPERTR